MAFFTDNASINTILGEGSSLASDVKVNGNLRIEGDVDGNVTALGNVFVGEKARIRGNVTSESAEIYGIVRGDIDAPKFVKIFSTAAVIGDVFTNQVQIEENAIFQGHCVSLKNTQNFEEAKSNRLTARAVLENRVKTES